MNPEQIYKQKTRRQVEMLSARARVTSDLFIVVDLKESYIYLE